MDNPQVGDYTYLGIDKCMGTLIAILLLMGFVCFVAAIPGWGLPRFNLIAAGLACWILTALIPALAGMG